MRFGFAAVAVAALLAAPALAQTASQGYLPAGALDAARIVPPAPVAGTPLYQGDRATFLATRSLKDTPRWELAVKDDDARNIVGRFACALGGAPDEAKLPKLKALLSRVGRDLGAQVDPIKTLYRRQRPYLIDEGPICLAKTDALAKSPDYPSGHGALGWATGLILAELAPDRASELIARGRAFGESRVVCGVHNASAIEASRMAATAVVAALHGQAQFRADLEAARPELAEARQGATAPAACEIEVAALAKAPY